MLFLSHVDFANLPLMDLITGTFFPYRAVRGFENWEVRDCSQSLSTLSNYRDLSPYRAVGRFENPGVRDSLPNGLFHFGQLQGLIPVQCCWKVLKFGGVSGDVGA